MFKVVTRETEYWSEKKNRAVRRTFYVIVDTETYEEHSRWEKKADANNVLKDLQ